MALLATELINSFDGFDVQILDAGSPKNLLSDLEGVEEFRSTARAVTTTFDAALVPADLYAQADVSYLVNKRVKVGQLLRHHAGPDERVIWAKTTIVDGVTDIVCKVMTVQAV